MDRYNAKSASQLYKQQSKSLLNYLLCKVSSDIYHDDHALCLSITKGSTNSLDCLSFGKSEQLLLCHYKSYPSITKPIRNVQL